MSCYLLSIVIAGSSVVKFSQYIFINLKGNICRYLFKEKLSNNSSPSHVLLVSVEKIITTWSYLNGVYSLLYQQDNWQQVYPKIQSVTKNWYILLINYQMFAHIERFPSVSEIC